MVFHGRRSSIVATIRLAHVSTFMYDPNYARAARMYSSNESTYFVSDFSDYIHIIDLFNLLFPPCHDLQPVLLSPYFSSILNRIMAEMSFLKR